MKEEIKPMRWEVVVFIALFIAAVIIGTLFFMSLNKKDNPITPINDFDGNITKAFNEGVIISLVQLMQATDRCQVASVRYFNITRRLVDVDCVRALLQQQNITLKGG